MNGGPRRVGGLGRSATEMLGPQSYAKLTPSQQIVGPKCYLHETPFKKGTRNSLQLRSASSQTLSVVVSLASRRGQDKRGVHRRATDPLHFAIVCVECAYVATFRHMLSHFAICCHILPTTSHKSSSGEIAALLRRPRLS